MTIEVKRHCSSSIRNTPEYVTFGDFTITLSDEEAKAFHKLEEHIYHGWKLTDILVDIIDTGLDELLEHDLELGE